ncbi:MAG: hypothetical protein ABF337_09980, partial [Akkermansiaceae bacterium]
LEIVPNDDFDYESEADSVTNPKFVTKIFRLTPTSPWSYYHNSSFTEGNGILSNIRVVIPELDTQGQEISGVVKAAAELKVAKMENSLVVTKNNGQILKEDLTIDDDVDRFYIKIPRAEDLLENGDVSIGLKTSGNEDDSYDDNSTNIPLVLQDLEYTSKSLMLMADHIDDDYSGFSDIVADDVKDDRTHVIQLGGDLEISTLHIGDKIHAVNKTVKVKKKKQVTVNFVILNDGNINIPNIKEKINKDLEVMNERYAQVGIQVVKAGAIVVKPTPADLELPNGKLRVEKFGPFDGNWLSDDVKKVITACGTVNNLDDIHVVYSPYEAANALGTSYDGVAMLSGYYLSDPEDDSHSNNVIMSIGQPMKTTLAHEIGHILKLEHVEFWADIGDENWLKKSSNLMTAEPFLPAINRISGPLRLLKRQEEKMRDSPLAKDPN